MNSFHVYKMVDQRYVRWSTIEYPSGSTPQGVREELMLKFPNDSFMVIKNSWIIRA